MTLSLDSINDAIQFRGSNGSYDVAIAPSDDQEGISPMEMTALSIVDSSSIDILLILEKQKQEVDIDRAEESPRVTGLACTTRSTRT